MLPIMQLYHQHFCRTLGCVMLAEANVPKILTNQAQMRGGTQRSHFLFISHLQTSFSTLLPQVT